MPARKHFDGPTSYEIDRASIMLTSEEWIPLEGVHEALLVRELVQQERRFSMPLRYDARTAAAFANAILLDAGAEPIALHVVSAFMTPAERQCKERAVRAAGGAAWVWDMGESMPELPPAAVLRSTATVRHRVVQRPGRPSKCSGAQ